jgi:alcohol dehydrogenase
VRRWSDFQPNTDSADLKVGLEVLREFHRPDLVLGVGGGSALDMAKLLVSFAEVPPDEVVGPDRRRAQGNVAVRAPGSWHRPPVALAPKPPTSPSSTWVTKHSIGGPAMRADAIVLDPALTLSGSAYQRATSGIDAVAQAIESLWAVGATIAAGGSLDTLCACSCRPSRPTSTIRTTRAARAMAIGSHLAGRAIDISKTTASHALSYAVTKGFGVSHGHAVAISLGPLIALHDDQRGQELQDGIDSRQHARTMTLICGLLGSTDGVQAAARFSDLMQCIGLTSSAIDLGIETPAQRRALASQVNPERLSNNPVLLSQRQIEQVLDH